MTATPEDRNVLASTFQRLEMPVTRGQDYTLKCVVPLKHMRARGEFTVYMVRPCCWRTRRNSTLLDLYVLQSHGVVGVLVHVLVLTVSDKLLTL